jgi:hypothetical protein
MRYYLRAATEILGMPVKRATLVFLTPKQERVVTDSGAGLSTDFAG